MSGPPWFPAVLPVLMLSFGASACAGAEGDPPAHAPAAGSVHRAPLVSGGNATAALRAADSALQQAVAARDVDRTATFYAPDAVLLPAAEPQITGREAIRAEWAKLFAIPAFANTSRTTQLEVAASGELAFTRGVYETRLTGQDRRPVTERGKWVSVWRRQADGSWRIVVDAYNTDTPPPDHL